MDPQEQWLQQKERVLAWVRFGFAIAAILVIQLNPERGARFPVLSRVSLLSFFFYSALIAFLVARATSWARAKLARLALLTTCLDLLWVSVIVYSTGPSPTPFFVYYFFPIVTASFRYGTRGGLLAALVGLSVYAVIRFSPLTDEVLPLDIYIIRSIYLLVLAYIFGLLSEFEHKQSAKLVALYKTAADAAAQEERRRIARELHDRLLQSLATLSLRLEACRRNVSVASPDETVRELQSMEEMTSYSIADIRRFLTGKEVGSLAPGTLLESLKEDMKFLRDGLGIHVILENEPEELDLPLEAERELYYVVREGLMNIAKHSHASKAAVWLRATAQQIRGVVEDDGVGFEAERHTAGDTLGLRSMEERINKLGGKLEVHSAAGKGTRLSFAIPIPS
jgi:signal transduction histidine kinase